MVKRQSSNIGTITSRCHKRRMLQSETKMTSEESPILNRRADFTCGVVEGFYGRPWTTEQRKLLFSWMKKMGLNTYMYAPKDDCKHRVYWRELYSVEEADNLTSLIQAAHGCGISFVYAISPGLDMTFSKDVQYLKRKLDQVGQFGCNAFAILFDDIDPELCEADKSVFQSSAHAQVSVTNEVFQHLGQPNFLFCPTEYCASRALPTVTLSGYLNTLGSKLLPGVDILWTGPKVVSKKLSIQSLEEIASVLRRPPVIWDNIHANDYDPRRIFLGPYDYRSPEVIPYLRGVMTNPNTEFEANYIPCHTLAQWCKSNPERVKKDIISSERLSPVAADIKLETENELIAENDLPCRLDSRYQAREALKAALAEWQHEVNASRHASRKQMPPSFPPFTAVSVNTCGATSAGNVTVPIPPVVPIPELAAPAVSTLVEALENPSFMQPASMNIVNSLVDVSESESETDSITDSSEATEPMECAPVPMEVAKAVPAEHMQEEMEAVVETSKTECSLTLEELSLMVDLFYLPFEHGTRGLEILADMHWLINNAHYCRMNKKKSEKQEWEEKAAKMQNHFNTINQMVSKFLDIPNKSLVQTMYPYIWDFMGILKVAEAFIKWLGFTSGYREAFLSGDQEPWVFRGGLQAEYQRLLPMESAQDLFFLKPPENLIEKNYNYRPYVCADEKSVYQICLKTCDDGMDGTEVFPDYPDLIGDRLLGSLTTLSPEYCFVVEDEEGICGYALAALDAKVLHNNSTMAWVPVMREKYPKVDKEEITPADEIIASFHKDPLMVNEVVYSRHPSVIRLDVLPSRITDPSVPKRLLACALCALKTNGSPGVHCELNVGDKYLMDFYSHMGFFPLTSPEVVGEEHSYVGRVV